MRKQLNNHVSGQVGANKICGSGSAGYSANPELDLLGNAIQLSIHPCDFDCIHVSIQRFNTSVRKEFGRRNREYAGASANVEKTITVEIFFDCAQTKARCFVSTSAKRHARFDADDELACVFSEFSPWRRDDKVTNP